MSTQIEVLQWGPEIRAAFYYLVPSNQQLPGAENQNRTPAGVALSPQELQALKDGALFEFIFAVDKQSSWTTQQIQARLVQLYNEKQLAAGREYKRRYSTAKNVYRDGVWT